MNGGVYTKEKWGLTALREGVADRILLRGRVILRYTALTGFLLLKARVIR